jgi:hypothetical protein
MINAVMGDEESKNEPEQIATNIIRVTYIRGYGAE